MAFRKILRRLDPGKGKPPLEAMHPQKTCCPNLMRQAMLELRTPQLSPTSPPNPRRAYSEHPTSEARVKRELISGSHHADLDVTPQVWNCVEKHICSEKQEESS